MKEGKCTRQRQAKVVGKSSVGRSLVGVDHLQASPFRCKKASGRNLRRYYGLLLVQQRCVGANNLKHPRANNGGAD